jgi:predicted ester cyclase
MASSPSCPRRPPVTEHRLLCLTHGLAGMKKTIARNRESTPDLVITIDDQISEGSKVATRWTATMTQQGKKVSLKGITIDRFENGKIVEAWRTIDMLGLLRQTGAIQK